MVHSAISIGYKLVKSAIRLILTIISQVIKLAIRYSGAIQKGGTIFMKAIVIKEPGHVVLEEKRFRSRSRDLCV